MVTLHELDNGDVERRIVMDHTLSLKHFITEHHETDSPRISIYMPTHRMSPENKKDPILFKNLLADAKKILDHKYPRKDWEAIVRKLESMQEDIKFWNHTADGLAVLADAMDIKTFRLETNVPSYVVVDDYFYLVPLLQYFDPMGNAYLMDLSKDRFTLYRVSRNMVEEVNQDLIETSFAELFNDFDAQAGLNFGGYGGGNAAYHGHRAKPEEEEKDRDKYFRYIDSKLPGVIREEEIPVILAGIPDNTSEYKKLAKGTFYLDATIDKPFDSMDMDQKLSSVREILLPRFEKQINDLKERYDYLHSQGKVSIGLKNVEENAEAARIEILFLSEDQDKETLHLVNDLVTKVITAGGDVVILDAGRARNKISAILRY